MSKKKVDSEKIEAIRDLRRMGLRPGACVYTSVVHVSRSGMSRHLRLYMVARVRRRGPDGKERVVHEICNITRAAALICHLRRSKCGDVIVSGLGMDMCWQTVYILGREMFPEGGPIERSQRFRQGVRAREETIANAHAAAIGLADPILETDGGYLLRNETI